MPDLKQELLDSLKPNSLAKTREIITSQSGLSSINSDFVKPLSGEQAYYLALALRQEHTGVKFLANKPQVTDILLEKDHPYIANIIVESLKHTKTGAERLKDPDFKASIAKAKESYSTVNDHTIGQLQSTVAEHEETNNKVLGKIRRKTDESKDSQQSPTTVAGRIGKQTPITRGQRPSENQLTR